MDVVWTKIDKKIDSVSSVNTDVEEILAQSWDPKSFIVQIPVENTTIDFDIRKLTGSLGDYSKVLHREGDFEAIKKALMKYWQYKGKPTVYSELLHTADDVVELRSKVAVTDQHRERITNLNRLIQDVNNSITYDRAVIGNDSDKLEIQFLTTNSRTEIAKDDFVDCGLFVTVDNNIKVAAGVNRLVCTNGLTREMYLWKGRDYKFGDDFLKRAMDLAVWFTEQGDRRVVGTRELSIALRDYPQPLLNRFWKSWSERVDLKELSWQNVINDLTQAVNTTLSSVRYKVLQTPTVLETFEKEHRCPICSAASH